MRLTRVPDDPPPLRPPEVVATIGNFDGVHRGHRALIGRLIERAATLGVESAVVTFDPHPLLVIRPQAAPRLLSTVDEKAELFGALAVDNLLVCRFDGALQQTGAREFLQQLGRWVRLRRLIFGPGFALGKGREGTTEVLRQLGQEMGFDLEEVTPFVSEPATGHVSSTAIRHQLAAGEVQRAAQGLGRYPTVTGTVIAGERVGRTLGFPTANVQGEGDLAVPADGVYAGWAEVAPFTPPPGATRRRSASAPAPPSTASRGRWRRTCWTSPATSTGSACACTSWPACGARSASIPSPP